MENRRIFKVMLAMAAQCCLGVLSSPGQSPNWCGLKNYKEISEEKFRIANEKPFIFMASAIIALIEGRDPCHDIGYELMQLKEAMNSGNLEALYLINDAFAGIEPSATPEMSKYIIKFGVREVINELIETLTEISNVRCNNQDSMNNSQIMDNIKKRQNSITSGVTTVVKSLYMRMQNYQALQPGMEFFINHTETKAIDGCVRAIKGFYNGSLIMLEAFTGSASDIENYLCALYERMNNTLKLFRSEIYILYGIVEFWASSKAEKNFDSLLELIILIQTGQDTMLNYIEAGLKTEFDAMDFKLKSVCGMVDNNTGCECCKFDMAEEKAKSYYNAAYDVLEHVTSSINKVTASTAIATRFSISESVNQVCSYIFDEIRFSKSTSDSVLQNLHNTYRSLSLSEIKNRYEILDRVITNDQTSTDYMGDLLKKCQISAIEHAQWAIDPVFNGLETLLGTMKGTGHGCNDSQSLIDRCRVNASSGWVTLSESWFNTLRLLAVYTSTKDRQSTMNMSQIQMNEPLTNSRMSDAVRIIFDKMSTALNNINSGNYLSPNYSIENYTDAVNETVNQLIGALDITFSPLPKNTTEAPWTSQPARTEIIGCVRKSIEIIFKAMQLAQCRDCKGFQAKIEEMEKQSSSNYTAAITKAHEFIANFDMKDVRVDAIMKQCLKKSLERSQDSCKNIFYAIRILAGQISPSSRISSSRSVILLNNLQLECNTNVKYRISFTYQAIQLRVVVSLIRKSKISDGFSLIEMQRQKAHAAVDKGFDVFFNEIRKNACSANYSGTDMIDSAANVTYTFFRVLTECAYYTMKTVIPETSSSVATVQGSTYAALNSMVGSLFTILRTIQQNELSGILQEMDIMKDTAVCLSHAVIDSWYVPLMKIAHQQNNTEMRYELNNTIFTLRNICSNVIETMVNDMKYYFQSTNNSISIEYQGTTSKQLFKPVTNSFFDDILLAFTADVMCNAKTTAHSC